MSAVTALPSNDPAIRILDALRLDGLHAALRMLNERTPHRFTGIYRYDAEMLRNVILFNVQDPETRRGGDIPMEASYCALLSASEFGALDFNDPHHDPIAKSRAPMTPVVSYCGVLLVDTEGKPFGSLCHYDLKPCQTRISDLDMLRALAPQLASAAMAMVLETSDG